MKISTNKRKNKFRALSLMLAIVLLASAVPSLPVLAAPAKYVKSLTLSKEKVSVEVGKTSKVKATVAVKGKPSKYVTVKSSDANIASVSVGEPNSDGISTITVKGKKKGTATITVKTKGKNKNSKVITKKLTVSVKKAESETGNNNESTGYVTDFFLQGDGDMREDNKFYFDIELSRTNKVSYSQIGSITISDPSAFEIYKIEESKKYIENKKATGYRYDLKDSRIIVKALKSNAKATLTVTTKDNGKNGKPIVDTMTLRSGILNDNLPEGYENWVGYEKLSFDEESVLSRIMALQKQYPQGSKWDGTNGYSSPYIKDSTGGHACVGFAAMLSDAAFYDAPLVHNSYSDPAKSLRVGDRLSISEIANNIEYAYEAIVLSNNNGALTLAVGNQAGKVNWNYKINLSDPNIIYVGWSTRYPE